MVLENQLAESSAFRSERPLTVMTVVSEILGANQPPWVSAGDTDLAFAAEHLASS